MALHPCGDRSACSPVRLLSAWAAGARSIPRWPQLGGGQVVLTHQARVAIAVLCRHWGLGPGDEILVPAYNCGTEIDPLRQSGAQVRFYRVDEHAGIDLDDLCGRVTDRTRMVYVIHYFGWPQPLAELASWCRQRRIWLAEDCALSLFSGDNRVPIGTVGDAAVFSFAKTLPVPDGGALVLRDGQTLAEEPLRRPPVARTWRRAASLAKGWVVARMPLASRPGSGSPPALETPEAESDSPDMPAGYYYDSRTTDWTLSRMTEGLLRGVAAEKIVRRRRSNYARLDRAIRGVAGIRPLFDSLPAGVCPLVFPAIVANRRQWVLSLRHQGIAAVAWWEGHHRCFDWRSFAESHRLKVQVLALPVHQDLDEGQMDYIAQCVSSLAQAPMAQVRA